MKAAVLCLLLAACATAPAPQAPAERAVDFDRVEEAVLRDLATSDARFAKRARITPLEEDRQRTAMAAVLGEDATLAVIDGAIDPFSFEARARSLATARTKVASLPADRARASERELLGRVVEDESMRLEEERQLPRSASALVRAIVEAWRPPASERQAAEIDRWLARRLDLVRDAMTAAPLDVVRARELDDALDALERITSGLTGTTQALVRLREAVEAAAQSPAAGAASSWDLVAARVRVHLGLAETDEALARTLDATEKALRERVVAALAGAEIRADDRLFVAGPCLDAVPGSLVRSLAAPPEREAACHLRHFVASSTDPARTLAVLHDHVVIAEWALDVARGAATIARAEAAHRLLVPVPPDLRARYERIALARPVAAIGAGMTARLLLVGGDPTARAAAWSGLGDVPLDIAAAELH